MPKPPGPAPQTRSLLPPSPPPALLKASLEEALVSRLLEKALARLEDIMDTAEDDALVGKTATYIIDLAKEVAGFGGKGTNSPNSGVNVAIFNPGYLAEMASGARKVFEGDVIEVTVDEKE